MGEQREVMPGPIDTNAELMADAAISRLVGMRPPQDASDVDQVVTEVMNQLRGDIGLQERMGEVAWNQVNQDLENRVRAQAKFSLEQRH